MKKITIVDYGCGNLLSIKRALDEIEIDSQVTNEKNKILNSDFLILPGVGAFENAVNLLKVNNLFSTIIEYSKKKKPILGICLGMQILFTKSFEMGENSGLNLIEGTVEKLNKKSLLDKIKIPHINWSRVNFEKKNKLNYMSIKLDGKSFYFVHSFMVFPKNQDIIVATSDYYDIKIPAIIKYENIVAFQFHPEKSGKNGLEILRRTFNLL